MCWWLILLVGYGATAHCGWTTPTATSNARPSRLHAKPHAGFDVVTTRRAITAQQGQTATGTAMDGAEKARFLSHVHTNASSLRWTSPIFTAISEGAVCLGAILTQLGPISILCFLAYAS